MDGRQRRDGAVKDRDRLIDAARHGPLDAHAELLQRLLSCDAVVLSVVDSTDQHFLGLAGIDGPIAEDRGTALSLSLCRFVADSGEPLIVDDLRRHPTLHTHGALTELGIHGYAGVPLRAPDGSAVGSVGGVSFGPRAWSEADQRTVTEVRDLAEAELAPVLAQAADRERATEIALLLSTLRHELGGDLAIVQGGIETALLPGLDDTMRGQVLRNAQRDCRRVVSALDALLRIDSRAPIQLATVQVSELAEAAIETSADTTEPGRVRFDIPEIEVTTQPVLVTHIVRNLVDNACKYSDGDVLVTAETLPDGQVAIAVTDTGRGLPPEVARQLFEPFARGRGDTTAPGFGLGLFIIRTLTDRLGGQLDLVSDETGTSVRLLLPT